MNSSKVSGELTKIQSVCYEWSSDLVEQNTGNKFAICFSFVLSNCVAGILDQWSS